MVLQCLFLFFVFSLWGLRLYECLSFSSKIQFENISRSLTFLCLDGAVDSCRILMKYST